MLFRKTNGELIELKKYDFANDKLYYEKLMEIKKPVLHSTKISLFFDQGYNFDQGNKFDQVYNSPKLEKTFTDKNN